MTQPRKSRLVSLRLTTLARLDVFKHTGQTYDGVIQEVLNRLDNQGKAHIDNKTTALMVK